MYLFCFLIFCEKASRMPGESCSVLNYILLSLVYPLLRYFQFIFSNELLFTMYLAEELLFQTQSRYIYAEAINICGCVCRY